MSSDEYREAVKKLIDDTKIDLISLPAFPVSEKPKVKLILEFPFRDTSNADIGKIVPGPEPSETTRDRSRKIRNLLLKKEE